MICLYHLKDKGFCQRREPQSSGVLKTESHPKSLETGIGDKSTDGSLVAKACFPLPVRDDVLQFCHPVVSPVNSWKMASMVASLKLETSFESADGDGMEKYGTREQHSASHRKSGSFSRNAQ